MTQLTTTSISSQRIEQSNTGQTLSNAVSTVILESEIPSGVRKLGVQIAPTVRALTAFLVEAKFHPAGAYVTITGAVTATPPAPVTSANATLATLAADAIGWMFMDTFGMAGVRISATCATAADGLIDAYAFGSTGEDVITQFSAIGSQEKSAQTVAAVMVNANTAFTIAGGPLEIVDLVSECVTDNNTVESTLQWQHNPTVGSAKTISAASASLVSLAAGGTVRLNQTSLATAPDIVTAANGGVAIGANVANKMILTPGVIKMVIGVGSTTGTWRHYLLYKPLSTSTTVTAN
jgi:hypothetical protein